MGTFTEPTTSDGKLPWEPAAFRAAERHYWGSMWGRWEIQHARGRYAVYLIDGPRLTEFDSLACARRFCEEIDALTDWSRPYVELSADRELGLAIHRAALRITGGRPALRVVPGDETNVAPVL